MATQLTSSQLPMLTTFFLKYIKPLKHLFSLLEMEQNQSCSIVLISSYLTNLTQKQIVCWNLYLFMYSLSSCILKAAKQLRPVTFRTKDTLFKKNHKIQLLTTVVQKVANRQICKAHNRSATVCVTAEQNLMAIIHHIQFDSGLFIHLNTSWFLSLTLQHVKTINTIY